MLSRRALAPLVALTLTTAAAAQTGRARGEVYNNLGHTLRDAALQLEGTDLRFPLNGQRAFEVELPPGRHVLVASAFGYRKVRRYLTIEPGGVTELDYVMTSVVHNPYRGAVRDGHSGGRLAATYEVLGTPLDPVPTLPNGMFSGYLPPGTYQVAFSAPGYYTSIETLRVPNQELVVRLKPLDVGAVLGEALDATQLVAAGLSELGAAGPRGVQRLARRRRVFR